MANSRVSLGGDETTTWPESSSLHGRPPSATCVPPPVAVKNAGIPEPPARIRSARVPCGVSSTSSSPERYWRGEALFFPPPPEGIRRGPPAPRTRAPPPPPTPPPFVTPPRPPGA